MEAFKKILQTPSALVLLLVAFVSLTGIVIQSKSNESIAKIPIDATLTAEAKLTLAATTPFLTLTNTVSPVNVEPITIQSNITGTQSTLKVDFTPIPKGTPIPSTCIFAYQTNIYSAPRNDIAPITQAQDKDTFKMYEAGYNQKGEIWFRVSIQRGDSLIFGYLKQVDECN